MAGAATHHGDEENPSDGDATVSPNAHKSRPNVLAPRSRSGKGVERGPYTILGAAWSLVQSGRRQVPQAADGVPSTTVGLENPSAELAVEHEERGLLVASHSNLIASSRSVVLLLNLLGNEPLELLLRRPITFFACSFEEGRWIISVTCFS